MKKQYKGIEIPSTVDGWALYDIQGADLAAAKLTAAIKVSIDELGRSRDMRQAWQVAGGIEGAMVDQQEYGAADTEPRDVAYGALLDYADLLESLAQ